ncbi:alpha-ketoglutarate-dependent dioxygenase AlkB family protein [Celeribacter sp.]|uniref:alpha-ketoglutarate-dependent dioxygenase AlkB family protein n=1 Tax=Celeribacter sp. TaxID=1890673 RepID=UPI003A930F2E
MSEFAANKALELRGMQVLKGLLDRDAQERMVEELRHVIRAAPLFSPVTQSGKIMSVRMTSAGRFGWISDRNGYRYSETHPDGMPWPEMPPLVSRVWDTVSGCARTPECCLINFYGESARMGMHQDIDEVDFSAPVVSISLGDDALFRVGNEARGGRTESIWLTSGDVVVMGGASRRLFHGVDRVKHGSSTLLPRAGRINVTLRVVT